MKVFNHEVQKDYVLKDVVRANLGVSDTFRTGGVLLKESRKEHLLMGVSVPEEQINNYLDLFHEGAPALCSVELSALAASAAFFHQKGSQTQSRTLCLIEGGATSITASFFVNNQLQIINQFEIGGGHLLKAIETGLGLDTETALEIAVDGSVDISSFVSTALGSVSRQLAISKEFVERQSRSHLSGCYVSGGLAIIPAWSSLLAQPLEALPEIWNPFDGLDLSDSDLAETWKGKEPLFAAAVGAALSSLGVS